MKSRFLATRIAILLGIAIVPVARAQTTNTWATFASGKWEIGTNWSRGLPPVSDTLTFLTNGGTKLVTIDAITVLSNSLNGCLTISNLSMSCPGGTTTLQLTNSGAATPFKIINGCDIHAGANILVTNSVMQVEGPFQILNAIENANLSVKTSATAAVVGPLTVTGNTSVFGQIFVSGQLVVTNNPALVGAGLGFIVDGSVILSNQSTLGVSNVDTVVGNTGSGSLTLGSGSSALVSNLVVGNLSGSQGTCTIAGGINNVNGSLNIGLNASATGTVWLSSGQLNNISSSSSTVSVGNAGVGQMTVSNGTWQSRIVAVGNTSGSQGTLTIPGGVAAIIGTLNIGLKAGATGTVWLTGGNLTLGSSTINVGGSGVGQMIVSNGFWFSQGVVVGNNAGSQGTLTVAGDTNSVGILNIGLTAGSTGTVWLTGGQLTINSSTLFMNVGNTGVGQMTVSNAAWQCQMAAVGNNPGSQGTLTIAGGTSTILSNLTLGDLNCTSTGILNIVGGSLFVTNAAGNAVLEVRSGTVILNSGTVVVDKFVMTNSCAHFVRTGGTLIYSIAVLDPNRDDDGDGIPNGYEQSHGLDPLNPADASADNDGDGFSNLQEYLAGTDPNNSASAFRITSISQTGNNVLVTWMMGPGKTNALQVTSGVGGGAYATNSFTSLFIVTNTVGTTTNFLDVGGATNRPASYYRVRLVP